MKSKTKNKKRCFQIILQKETVNQKYSQLLVLKTRMIKPLSILHSLDLGMMAFPSSPLSTFIILLVILFQCSTSQKYENKNNQGSQGTDYLCWSSSSGSQSYVVLLKKQIVIEKTVPEKFSTKYKSLDKNVMLEGNGGNRQSNRSSRR